MEVFRIRYIKDEEFIRGKCPMTKEEVRILSISKMELESDYRVLDVGAGTGSISIQVAKIVKEGNVVAIEKNKEAIEVIKKNMERFDLHNLTIIEDEALKVSSDIKGEFHSIFIGGSCGNIERIIKIYGEKLKIEGSMVLNFITLDNAYKAIEALKKNGYEVECSQIGVSKMREGTYMLMANNPIFIVKGKKQKEV